MKQKIYCGSGMHTRLEKILAEIGCRKLLLVCDSSYPFLSVKEYFDNLNLPCVKFDGFTPNPLYEDVKNGVQLFNDEKCDAIVALGGGSTIDTAKCIKLYCKMNQTENYLTQEYNDTGVKLIAFPTTAGTGSESTRYAVIYYEGKKQSVTHDSIVPDYVILEPDVLKTLPTYQKKCTLLDALCQAVESWWSVNSNDESILYSKNAISLITENMSAYLDENTAESAEKIMLGANYAGRAINITQTTAAHAMSYKLTSMFKLPHGHAVAVCLPLVWRYMNENLDKCIDGRGESYLKTVFQNIASALGCESVEEAIAWFEDMLLQLDIKKPENISGEEIQTLVKSVNLTRLKNNPVALSEDALTMLYMAR